MTLKKVRFVCKDIPEKVKEDFENVKETETVTFIPNNNIDAHYATVSETKENNWEPELNLEPIHAWEVYSIIRQTHGGEGMIVKTSAILEPVLASGLRDPFGDGERPSAIFYKSTEQWYVPQLESGQGTGSCLEFLIEREKKLERYAEMEEEIIEI